MKKRMMILTSLLLAVCLFLPACQRGSREEEPEPSVATQRETETAASTPRETKPSETAEKTTAASKEKVKTPIRKRDDPPKESSAEAQTEESSREDESTAPGEASETSKASESEAAQSSESSAEPSETTEGEEPRKEIAVPEDFNHLVLQDTEQLYFEILDVFNDEEDGWSFNVAMQNRTDNQCWISLERVSLNDYMVDPYFSVLVQGEESLEETVSWWMDDLVEDYGFSEITSMAFELRMFDDINGEFLLQDYYSFYPMGEEKYEPWERGEEAEGFVLFDNDYGYGVLREIYDSEEDGIEMHVYIENPNEEELCYVFMNAVINGSETESIYSMYCMPGKRVKRPVIWSREILNFLEIKALEELELELIITAYDDYLIEEPYFEEVYTITAEYD